MRPRKSPAEAGLGEENLNFACQFALVVDWNRPLSPLRMPLVRRSPLLQAYSRAAAILRDELHPGIRKRSFQCLQSGGIAGVPANFKVCDRISMKSAGIGEIPNRPVQGRPSHSNLCACHRHGVVPLSHVPCAQGAGSCLTVRVKLIGELS